SLGHWICVIFGDVIACVMFANVGKPVKRGVSRLKEHLGHISGSWSCKLSKMARKPNSSSKASAAIDQYTFFRKQAG
ncbi:hypothetical protein ACJX0J_008110, partial [Zea mays]